MTLHRNGGKAYLWSRLMPLIVFMIALIALLSAGSVAFAQEYELQDVMNGSVPDVTAQVSGSGSGYYGDSMRVYFNNDTGQTLRVKIPIGLRLAPENTSVQTMITAGGELITVPPGSSSAVFKAFCGEQDDSAPSSSDVFHPDGFVDSALMKTLKRINEKNAHDSDGQAAVWSHTDDYDISDNEKAKDLAGGGMVSAGKVAAAGIVGAGAAAAGAGAINLASRNGGASGKSGVKTPDKPKPRLDSDESFEELLKDFEEADLPEEVEEPKPPGEAKRPEDERDQDYDEWVGPDGKVVSKKAEAEPPEQKAEKAEDTETTEEGEEQQAEKKEAKPGKAYIEVARVGDVQIVFDPVTREVKVAGGGFTVSKEHHTYSVTVDGKVVVYDKDTGEVKVSDGRFTVEHEGKRYTVTKDNKVISFNPATGEGKVSDGHYTFETKDEILTVTKDKKIIQFGKSTGDFKVSDGHYTLQRGDNTYTFAKDGRVISYDRAREALTVKWPHKRFMVGEGGQFGAGRTWPLGGTGARYYAEFDRYLRETATGGRDMVSEMRVGVESKDFGVYWEKGPGGTGVRFGKRWKF